MTPVHVVSGWLGAGKTTMLLDLVARLPGRSAVVVNDFGDARIDATLLGSDGVVDIPGGCVCCTAPAGLVPAVLGLLESQRPDRVFIEPSGLARPQDVVDMLTRGPLAAQVRVQPVIVLVDPNLLLAPPEGLLVQLDAADVLVANRVDLASVEGLARFHAVADALWPGPAERLEVVHGRLAELPTWDTLPARATSGEAREPDAHAHHGHTHAVARSWVFPRGARFAWDRLRDAVQDPALLRFKGLFEGDIGHVRVDWAGGRLSVAPTAYRRDSRADAIADDAGTLDRVDAALHAARMEADTRAPGPQVRLLDADGVGLLLDARALDGLPGRIADVGGKVPGRAGPAVPLAEVLALAAPRAGDRFVLVASDGMVAGPSEFVVGEAAWLAYTVPDTQGGPFRVLVAPGSSACANVKGVTTIRIVRGAS